MSLIPPVPIKGFLETSFLDWPGKICAVVFLPGCNFRCPFCHNGALIFTPHELETIPLSRVTAHMVDFSGWIDGICITGGEPTIHRNLHWLLQEFKELGSAVKLDTNGSNPAVLETLLEDELLDCVAMDIKAPLDADVYSRLAGRPVDLSAVEQSIHLIREADIETVFRMTVVPGLLNEENIFEAATALGPCNRLLLQQFNPKHVLDASLSTTAPWPQEKLAFLQSVVDNTAFRQGNQFIGVTDFAAHAHTIP